MLGESDGLAGIHNVSTGAMLGESDGLAGIHYVSTGASNVRGK